MHGDDPEGCCVGGVFMFGIACTPMVDSCQCMAKPIQNLATEFEELSIGSDVLDEIVRRFKQRGTLLGENSNIDYAVVEKILKG